MIEALSFWKRAAALLALIALFAVAGARDGEDAEIAAKVEAEAFTRLPCAVTIAQYDAGERWSLKPQQPVCAGGMDALANHILTSPLGEQQ